MSENGEIYTAGKNFTRPPALTAWTNSTSADTPLSIKLMIVNVKPNLSGGRQKSNPYFYLGIDEGAGVDDLDIVGLMHHIHSLDVSLPPPPSGQTPKPKSPCLLLQFCSSFQLGVSEQVF